MKKGNVENQREHLILLLANIDVRHRDEENYSLVRFYLSVAHLFFFIIIKSVSVSLMVSTTIYFCKCIKSKKLFSNLCINSQLDTGTVRDLKKKVFKNYISWCDYLHQKPNLKYVMQLFNQNALSGNE